MKAASKESLPAVRGTRGRDAVKWLQKAFSLSEPLEGSENMSTRHLRVCHVQLYSVATLGLTWNAPPRSTEGHLAQPWCVSAAHMLTQLTDIAAHYVARAYYLSSSEEPENLVRAEASLNELISSVEGSQHVRTLTSLLLRDLTPLFPFPICVPQTATEYQQLRWMRIAVLKKQKAGYVPLLEGDYHLLAPVGAVRTDRSVQPFSLSSIICPSPMEASRSKCW